MVANYFVRKILVSVACTASLLWFCTVHQLNTQHRYTGFSFPGYVTPQNPHNGTNADPMQGLNTEENATDSSLSPYAYVF